MNLGKETEYIEFKRSLSETKEGLCSISAMLNKHHKGTLYFGVKDNGDVVGQNIGKDTLNKLSRDISEFIRPAVYYEVEQKNTQEGMSFIEVVFHGEHTPYSAYGRYYLRFHDEDRQMDNETLRKYNLDQRNVILNGKRLIPVFLLMMSITRYWKNILKKPSKRNALALRMTIPLQYLEN